MDNNIAATEMANEQIKTNAKTEENVEIKAAEEPEEKKVSLLMLGASLEFETAEIKFENATVIVKKRIPYEQVLDMIQWCINFIINDRPFISAPLKRIVQDFAILKFYTNLDMSFITEYKEMGEVYEHYDIADSTGIIPKVYELIEEEQLKFFTVTLAETLESIEKYKNSARGIVDILSEHATEDTAAMQSAVDMFKNEENAEKLTKILRIAEEIKQ